ncbi:MAG: DUF4911 domain-containing protein [Bacillota bacterium]|nr:DUF4911 domain-containing protein [Bacillota bacterium]
MKNEIYAVVRPEKIDKLTKLVEAYDHLGVVSTLDREAGLVIVRVTPDTFTDVEQILQNLPFYVEIVENKE